MSKKKSHGGVRHPLGRGHKAKSKVKIVIRDNSANGENDCWYWELRVERRLELGSVGEFDTREEAKEDAKLCKRLMAEAEVVDE